MGLPVSLLVRGPEPAGDRVAAAVAKVYAELRDVDATFSLYRPDSLLSRLSRGEPVERPAEVLEVEQRCEQAQLATGGAFDARRPDGVWDPSGLVKGWAAERASRHLAALDDHDWCVNAGGDVQVASPSGEAFRVGIEDPADRSRLLAVVERTAGAVATSGTAARGAHLYDPATGRPAGVLAAVTVVGPSLGEADVLATAAYVLGPGGLALVEAADGYEAMLVGRDGAQRCTTGWAVTISG